MRKNFSLSNNKGFTLIEMLISLVLLGLVLSIGYTAFSLNHKLTTSQLKESSQRDDALLAMTYLTNDIKYSKSMIVVNEKRIDIVDKDNVSITYTLYEDGGIKYLKRQKPGSSETFKEIGDVKFSLPHDDLVAARLYTDTPNNKYNDFKISRYEYALKKPEDDFTQFIREKAVFVFGSKFHFDGSNISGSNNAIYIQGDLVTSDLNGGNFTDVKNVYVRGNVSLDGGSAGLGLRDNSGFIYVNGNMSVWSGTREINGTVYVGGNFRLKDAIINGTIYVDGDLELGWTPTINGRIEYTGTLKYPNNYHNYILDKCKKVDSVPTQIVPEYKLPGLRPDSWYAQKGYVSGGALSDNIKIFASDYSSDSHLSSSNVVIVSKKDIDLRGWRNISGFLFAPNGKITFSGASFTGVALSRDGFFTTSGGSYIYAREVDDCFSSVTDYPFTPN